MSIFAIPAKERRTKIVLDQWLSFILFFAKISNIYLMLRRYKSQNVRQTRYKIKISFSKIPDDVYLYSINGDEVLRFVDHNQYTLESMKLFIGGVSELGSIVTYPTAVGSVKNINLEKTKRQPGI